MTEVYWYSVSQPCLLFITKEETNIAAARGAESQSQEIVWLPNLEQRNHMKPVMANIGIYDVFSDLAYMMYFLIPCFDANLGLYLGTETLCH